MKRQSMVLLGILTFAVIATPLALASNADAAHSKAGKFLIPPDVIPQINADKHVTIPVHHILVHPATQVPVIGQSPVKSQVDVDWSCGNDDSKKGNSENKCDFKKDLKDKSNNGNSQGNSGDDSNQTAKSEGAFHDDSSNDTNSQDNSYDVNATEVLAHDNDSTVNFTVK